MATSPVLTYSMSYTIWNPITSTEQHIPFNIGDKIRRNFNEHFNTISVTYNSNISLNRYEVRATEIPADQDPLVQRQSWGVREGEILYEDFGGIAANQDHTFQIVIDSIKLNPTKSYRIGLYARSAIDNTWDATELFIITDGIFLVKPDGTWFETIVQDNSSWEYPELNDGNLSITQVFKITQNENRLEFE